MVRHTLQRASFKVAYFSCDYSGLPMRTGGAFLPHWKGTKMSKRGNFCSWEAALLHASDLADAEDRRRAIAYIMEETHHTITQAALPTSALLKHMGGDLNAEEWLERLWRPTKPLSVVHVDMAGNVSNREVPVVDGSYAWECMLRHPEGHSWDTGSVVSEYVELGDMAISVFSPGKGQVNSKASGIAGRTIIGEAVFARYVVEPAITTRTRFVPLGGIPSTPTYSDLLASLAAQLSSFETASSASAEQPQELAQAAKIPSPHGKELAALARMRAAEKAVECLPSARAAALEGRLVAAAVV